MNSIINLWFVVAVLGVILPTVWMDTVTPVEQCPGEDFDNLQDRIHVTPCGKTRCKLPRNTNVTVEFRFVPKKEVKTLVNNVYAEITGIPLPFVGVSGTSACGHVSYAATGEPASCPLAAGTEYFYTNIFPVLPFYPTVSMTVHWSLDDGADKVICFEVPAIITAQGGKKSRL